MVSVLNSGATERLSAEDAVFFYLDTKEMPLHIASVLIFDGPIPLQAFKDLISSKLPLIPRYRQRIIVPPFNIGHPIWEWDPQFDIDKHIRSVRLKRGTEAELQTVTGHILSEMMDRSKPLWDIVLVDGLKGGRSAMIPRVHHCLVDGVAGIGLLNVLFDPDSHPSPDQKQSHATPRPRASGDSFIENILSSYSEMFDRVLSIESAALNIAEAVVENGVSALDQTVRLLPTLVGSVDRLPFNKPCPGPRKLVWTGVSMADVSAIREACGGKLNDVVLTVVTGAIRRYTQLHHQPVRGRLLRLMVPVNMRSAENGDQNGLGNRVSMFPVIVPLDIADPVKLLHAVRERTEVLKHSNISEIVRLAGNWVGFIPAPVQALIGPYADSLPLMIPPWNMVCTNVPGPQVALFALGREMLMTYPYVPIGAEMGLNVAIQSYNGKLTFGFTGSEAAAPDVDIVPHLLDEAFNELLHAAGVKHARASRRPKPAGSVSAPKTNGFRPGSRVPAPQARHATV